MFKTNEYFDGKVQSIAFQGKDKPATVGVMAAGEYVFNTAEKEKMTVIKISYQFAVGSYQLKAKNCFKNNSNFLKSHKSSQAVFVFN